MAKRCTICGKQAEFCIKNSSECYCKECAEENFADIGMLQKLDSDARRLKRFLKDNEPSYDSEEFQEKS